MQIKGKTALVTGASGGIGGEIAKSIYMRGGRPILVGRNKARLEAVRDQMGRHDLPILLANLDQPDELEALAEDLMEREGRIDMLINNAGYGVKRLVAKGRLDEWRRTIDINLIAPMLLSRAVLPGMIEAGEGAIVNISSISGLIGSKEGSAYSASKFGLRGFAQSLFEEVREHNVKVVSVFPGYVDTPLVPPSKKLERERMIPPEDVASAVVEAIESSMRTCPTEITLRPQRSPYRNR